MTDVIVSILDKDEKVVWSKGFKEFPDPLKTLKTKGVFGRFVKIRMQKEGSLRIAEVIVK
ncbi:hypothetical protein ACU8V7_03060 [Zobellia nedashkovskayae]